MSGAGTEPAERELEEATGTARARAPAPCVCVCARARAARGSSEPPPGGREGEGQVSVCGSRAPARGFPSPSPSEPWPSGCPLPFSGPAPLLFAPHSASSHLPYRPSRRSPRSPLPPPPTAMLGYCFRVRVACGVREGRLGVGPGRAALAMPRSRLGDRLTGPPPPYLPPLPRRDICRSFAPFLCRPCSFPRQIFPQIPKIQVPAHLHQLGAMESVFPIRRAHGVGWCNLETLLFSSSAPWGWPC